MILKRSNIVTIRIDHRGNVAGGFNHQSVDWQLRQQRRMQDNHTRQVQDTFESAPYLPIPRNKNHIYWKELEEVLPQKIKLAKELQTMFKPVNQYYSWNHKTKIYGTSKCLDNPLNIIKNAYNMKVDTSEYQANRNYFSRLYKSMTGADIPHSDILAVYGNPYINAATNWNIMLYQKQQSIRNQYPGIDDVAKGISSVKYDFANVLSKTTPEIRQFVNDFAIPITVASTKGNSSLLSRASKNIVNACYKYNDFTERAWEIGWMHTVFDDDTLLNSSERQKFKDWIINREMREKQHGFMEIFGAVLNVAEVTGVTSSFNVMKMPKLAYTQRWDFRRAFEKLGYSPQAMEEILKKAAKDARKIHIETGIKFDKFGFPDFGKLVKVDVRISGDLANMTSQAHQRAATKVLRDLIRSRKVKKSMFTKEELLKIQRGEAKFSENYTWHHHQEPGRMQLVPTDVHSKVGHTGGNAIWGKKGK